MTVCKVISMLKIPYVHCNRYKHMVLAHPISITYVDLFCAHQQRWCNSLDMLVACMLTLITRLIDPKLKPASVLTGCDLSHWEWFVSLPPNRKGCGALCARPRPWPRRDGPTAAGINGISEQGTHIHGRD
jgi:hypothetical protein